jgi:hypothetical protein
MATANVPLQGKRLPGSTMIKCKWVKTYCNKCYIFNPLAFEMQMVRICSPNETLSIHLHKESSGDNSATHDTVSMMQHVLTRSVGVICLSRYLQHLTLTGYKKLKHYKHLITCIIVTRSQNQPHPTLQIPRHTRRPTGTLSLLTTGTINRWSAPGNANSLNCRTVSSNYPCAENIVNNLIQSLFGDSASAR